MHDHQSRVLDIYREVDEVIRTFTESTGISCVLGCGECCRRFEPYISVLEATIIAGHLIADHEAMQAFIHAPRDKKEVLCPFFDPHNPYHCGIYSIRPLICRLFAFSARTISDVLCYEACKAICRHHVEKVEAANHLIRQGLVIPIYREVYQRLKEIDFYLSTDQHPLTRSVEIAIEQQSQIACGEYRPALKGFSPPCRSGDEAQGVQHPESQSMAIPFSRWLRQHLAAPPPKTK